MEWIIVSIIYYSINAVSMFFQEYSSPEMLFYSHVKKKKKSFNNKNYFNLKVKIQQITEFFTLLWSSLTL